MITGHGVNRSYDAAAATNYREHTTTDILNHLTDTIYHETRLQFWLMISFGSRSEFGSLTSNEATRPNSSAY